MKHPWLLLVVTVLPALLVAQSVAQAESGPYARIAVLRPHDGDTVDFEAGYIRHLAWHQQAKDTWAWYGWTVWAGERQRWFIYATFGHSAASLDTPVSLADDERDNVSNVAPHVEYMGNAVYEYLPGLSRSTGEPQPTRCGKLVKTRSTGCRTISTGWCERRTIRWRWPITFAKRSGRLMRKWPLPTSARWTNIMQ